MKKKELKKLRRKAVGAMMLNLSWSAEMPDEVYEYLKVIEKRIWNE